MEEMVLPELTDEQIEHLCSLAEEAARKHVVSKVPSKKIETLNISAEAEGTKPLKLIVEVDFALSIAMRGYDTKELGDQAVERAFAVAEEYLRELSCHSNR